MFRSKERFGNPTDFLGRPARVSSTTHETSDWRSRSRRVEAIQPPIFTPRPTSTHAPSTEQGTDGLLLLTVFGGSELIGAGGGWGIAHFIIRPNFGVDANNPEAIAIGVGMGLGVIAASVIYCALAENPDFRL